MANAFRKYFLVKDAKAKGTQSPMENDCGEFKQLSKGKKKNSCLNSLRTPDLKCSMGVRKFEQRYVVRLISTLQYCSK